jgi:hypothetical protein
MPGVEGVFFTPYFSRCWYSALVHQRDGGVRTFSGRMRAAKPGALSTERFAEMYGALDLFKPRLEMGALTCLVCKFRIRRQLTEPAFSCPLFRHSHQSLADATTTRLWYYIPALYVWYG